jgi:hypothetical protein
MSSKFIGSFFSGKWDSIIDCLYVEDGDPKIFGEDFFQNVDGRFDYNINILKNAGYDKVDTVEWINYYPGKHFDPLPVKEFEKYAGVKCARAWISKIRPGKYAPIHQDIDDNIEQYLAQGEVIRYSTFISQPHPGGVFILGNQCFHTEASGNTYQWEDYMDWHAGGNCGLHDKFMFHFLGIK